MKQSSRRFLNNLLSAIGPSGYEQDAAVLWKKEARSITDDVMVDVHGNVTAILNPGGSPRVMLAGHIDEIGFMVTHIDSEGFLHFRPIGGWDPQVVVAQRVWIRTAKGRVRGIIGKKPVHLLKQSERSKVTEIKQMWIDIGAKNKKEAERKVAVGDPVVIAWEVEDLGKDLIVSRGFDNRGGAFVALETLRTLKKLKPRTEIHAVATVQEEIGLRGARTSAYGVDPDVGIAIDVTFATDHPGMSGDIRGMGACKMGGGPVISRGANINHKLYDLLVSTAKQKKIKWQLSPEPRGTGTDANAIQLSRAGVATGLVSIPNRYMHSPCEVCSLKDLDAIVNLLAHTIMKITPRTSFRPY